MRCRFIVALLLAWTRATVGTIAPQPVQAHVATDAALQRLPRYLGFTLDWWPVQGRDPQGWGNASLLSIDLTNARLRSLSRSLGPVTLRVGGSLDNIVQYLVGAMTPAACERSIPFRGSSYSLCLNVTRWTELLGFVSRDLAPGSALVFGLQLALGGENGSTGPWNSTNVLDFLALAAASADAGVIAGFEVGEETTPSPTSAGWPYLIEAYRGIHAEVARLWPAAASRPRIGGPCGGMGTNTAPFPWTRPFTDAVMKDAEGPLIDDFVMHSYNNDGGHGWTVPGFLNETASQAQQLRAFLDGYSGPTIPLVCGECGPHNGGGIANVTDRAISSFWFTDALLSPPLLGVSRFYRQSLAGGHYSLLRSIDRSFSPNPDYFAAYVFATLAGPTLTLLNVTVTSGVQPSLRVYGMCAAGNGGGVVIAWVNIDATAAFSLTVDPSLGANRMEYHLEPSAGNILSPTLMLNGMPLVVSGNDAPALVGVAGDVGAPLLIAPRTFGYAAFADAAAPACLS